jgi:ribosomal protein S18 acetylase RimI-like enzyme
MLDGEARVRSQAQEALLLLFAGLKPPALFCMGEPAAVAAGLDAAPLPDRLYLTGLPEHWPVVEERYRLRFANRMFRMVLDARSFAPVKVSATRRLGSGDLATLQALFDTGSEGDADGFAPFQVEQGVFYGLWESGQLVAVAGTHLVAPTYGLAALGNVFTHPEHRGKGYGTACISRVTEELVQMGLQVVLNAAQANAKAVALYRRIGYQVYCGFLEGIGDARNREL